MNEIISYTAWNPVFCVFKVKYKMETEFENSLNR